MQGEVTAFGPGGREAALDAKGLLAKLDAGRQKLAPPFAPERIDLVSGVAETLV